MVLYHLAKLHLWSITHFFTRILHFDKITWQYNFIFKNIFSSALSNLSITNHFEINFKSNWYSITQEIGQMPLKVDEVKTTHVVLTLLLLTLNKYYSPVLVNSKYAQQILSEKPGYFVLTKKTPSAVKYMFKYTDVVPWHLLFTLNIFAALCFKRFAWRLTDIKFKCYFVNSTVNEDLLVI